jgi:GGDEF domain-containing protein
VVLLSEIDQPDHAFAVADKIHQVAASIAIAEHDILLKLSIGISVYPDNGETVDALLKKSDAAMYHSKTVNRQPIVKRLVNRLKKAERSRA